MSGVLLIQVLSRGCWVAMDPRLEEASHAGDLDALHLLLQQDRLLLERLTTTPTDNPLHIAALLGHADFAREILRRKPGLTRDLNTHGLSPMHLASAGGHLPVVRELLKEGGSELCLVRDKDGLMPIHSAAFKGRVQMLAELMEACPESARELTCSGDTVLHLAVKSHCFEAVKFLVDRIDSDEALNSRDEKGNTILHLAVAMRQLQTTKFLLTQPRIDVNGVNVRGLTALDGLLESPREHGDLALGEMILASGGKTAGVGIAPQSAAQTSSVMVTDPLTQPQNSSTLLRHLRETGLWFRSSDASWTESLPGPQRINSLTDDKENNIKVTVIVVATLIATITFQAGLNPPGGFNTAGKSVLGENLGTFLIYDMIGLFASLSVILLFICMVPRRSQKLSTIMLWVMWLAVYSTGLAFSAAASDIFPQTPAVTILLQGWYLILEITMVWAYFGSAFYWLSKVGWWKNKPRDGRNSVPRMGACLVMKRILVLVFIFTPAPNLASLALPGLPAVTESTDLTWKIIRYVRFLIISTPVVWAYLRCAIYLLRTVGWWEKAPVDGESNAPPIGAALVIKRILVLVVIAGTPLVVRLPKFPLHKFLHIWSWAYGIPIVWVCHRFIIYLLRIAGCWREHWDGQSNAQQMNVALVIITRTVVIVVVVAAIVGIARLYHYLVGVILQNY